MQSHHYLVLFIVLVAGVALQKYFDVWSKVGLPG